MTSLSQQIKPGCRERGRDHFSAAGGRETQLSFIINLPPCVGPPVCLDTPTRGPVVPPPYQQPCPRGSKYHKLHISDTSYHKATTPILFFFFLFFLPHQPSTIHERMLFQLFSQACRSILTHHCGVFCL